MLAHALEDPRRTGWIAVFESASLWQLGRAADAVEAAQRAVACNESAQDLPLSVGARFYLGCAHVTSGDAETAEALFADIAHVTDNP